VKFYHPSVQVRAGSGWITISRQHTSSKRKAEEWLSQTLYELTQEKMKIKSPCIRVEDAPRDERISEYPIQGEGIQGEWQDAFL
jgi:hypothetical protein